MSTSSKTPWNTIDADLAEWVEREAQAHPDWADFQNRWGTVLILKRRLPEALAVFDRCLAINPRYLWASVNRAQTLALMGETRAAREAAAGCPEIPLRLEAYLHAFLSLVEGDADGGDRHLARVEDSSECAPDWTRLSAALVHLRDPQRASAIWAGLVPGLEEMREVDITPWDSSGNLRTTSFVFGLHQLYLEMSSTEARRENHPAAETLAAIGLAVWSDRSAYLNQRGFLAGIRGEDDLAVRLFREAATVDAGDSRPHIALAYHFSAADDLDRARESLHHALRLAPGYADLQYQMGLLHLTDRKLEDALDSLDRALAINPDYSVARMEKAEVLFHLKRWEKALENYEHVLGSGLESSDIRIRMGQIELKLGRVDRAQAAFQRAGEINPEEPLVFYFMGKIHQLRGERNAAQDAWSRFLSLDVDPEMRLEIESALADEAA